MIVETLISSDFTSLDFIATLIINYFSELYRELKLQFGAFAFGYKLFNWKWFVFSFAVAFLIYAFKLKSIGRVFRRSYKFISQKRAQVEFIKDIKFFLVKCLYKPAILVFFAYDIHQTSSILRSSLVSLNLDIPTFFMLNPYLGPVFKMLLAMLIYDFAYYIVHSLEHNYSNLWIFHKVHHRATHLNPLTKLRVHPIEYFVSYGGVALIGTPIFFIVTSIYYIPNDPPLYVYYLGSLFINNCLTHLRHSHIKIHYGILSYVFVSPVMHQVHHSMLEKHHNKNYGTLFSLWDLFFGTFYLPKKKEVFKFGIKEERNQILSVTDEMVLPFHELYHFNKPKAKRPDYNLVTNKKPHLKT